jgi:hypothetical protein
MAEEMETPQHDGIDGYGIHRQNDQYSRIPARTERVLSERYVSAVV